MPELAAIENTLHAIDTKLTKATENHLHTIERNTGRTVELLGDMQNSMIEMVAILRDASKRG